MLMTADTMGGVWTYALDLAEALGWQGIQVALATMGNRPTREQRAAAESLGNVTVFESGYRLEWMSDPWLDVERAGEWLLDVMDDFRPDVVHLNSYVHASLPWPVPCLVVAHSCVLSWWNAVHGTRPPEEFDLYRDRVAEGLRAAQMVVAPTHAMLETLAGNYGEIASARVIPNGRDQSRFRPLCKEPLVVSAGRVWDEGKNIAALDHIAGSLPWPVQVAGDAQHPDGHEVKLANARHLGSISELEMANLLGRGAICALPALYEPFGLCALEAGLAGCALVLGDIPSFREIWDGAAEFVDPEDCDDLGRAIIDLIENSDARNQRATEARQRALLYTPREMAASYLAAYTELVSIPFSCVS